MTVEILTAIILSCQVTGTFSQNKYKEVTYSEAKTSQTECQQERLKCVKNERGNEVEAFIKCLKDD